MNAVESAQQAEEIRQFVQGMPSTQLLGIEIVSLGDGRSELTMAVRPELTFDGQHVQGGVVGVLADYAAVVAAGTTLDVGWRLATLSCETHNVRPAHGQRLTAYGEIIKGGRRHMVARADVRIDDADKTLCLTGLFTAVPIPPA